MSKKSKARKQQTEIKQEHQANHIINAIFICLIAITIVFLIVSAING